MIFFFFANLLMKNAKKYASCLLATPKIGFLIIVQSDKIFLSTENLHTVHATAEEIQNGDFTLRIRYFPSALRRGDLKTQESPVILDLCRFEEASFREIKRSPWRHRFRKAPFSKCFPCARKRKAIVFKFLQVEERFREASSLETAWGGWGTSSLSVEKKIA